MAYYANLFAPSSKHTLSFWGYVHLAIAVLHGLDTSHLLLTCAFRIKATRVRRKTAPAVSLLTQPATQPALAPVCTGPCGQRVRRGFRRVWHALAWLVTQVFGRRGLLGIESAHFDVVFSLRELVEMTAQCVQLYKYSRLLGRPWINDVLVAMFMIDCWDSLFLHWALRDHEALRRVVSLSVDAGIKIATNVVIPAFILIPYLLEFDYEMHVFSARRMYIDELFIAMVTENRSVFALSTLDGLSKVLVVPSELQTFSNLLSMEVFNSTIISWPPEAALSDEKHTQITYVALIRVNMTGLPDGLHHASIPPSLLDLEISISNLTHLPTDLAFMWHDMDVFFIEYSRLTEFPSVTLELNPYFLSLVGNEIREIPSLVFSPEANPLIRFMLSENPIESLPAFVNATINVLGLDGTLVKELPPWVATQQLHRQLASSRRLAIAVAIVLCQWICAAYLMLLAEVYWFIDLPDMTYYANLLALPSVRRLSFWGNAHLAIAVLHVIDTLSLLLSCALRRTVRRKAKPRSEDPVIPVNASENEREVAGGPVSRRAYRALRRVCSVLWRNGERVFGQSGLLGIESSLFDVVFSLRELIEMSAQAIQLHKFSTLLARPWINDVLVLMFTLDCWDSTLLHWWLRDREALRRVVALTVDAAMTIGTNVVVPAMILIPYVIELDKELYAFSAARMYIEELFIAMATENRSIPNDLQKFKNLLSMEIFNSTIVSWPTSAALIATIHTQVTYLGLIRVNMTALPAGVLHSALPPSLLDIEVSISNLTRLPPDLSSVWHPMDIVFVEYSQLTAFPSVILELNPFYLSLLGNDIRDIPPITLSPLANPLARLTLAENPIEELPHFTNAVISILALDGTRIKELPAWVATQVRQRVYMWNTPQARRVNPDRGFYRHAETTTTRMQPLTQEFVDALGDEITLVKRMYYLDAFTTIPQLSSTFLDVIRKDFDLLERAGKRAILRFAYAADDATADPAESVILNHLDQLAPVLQRVAPSLLVFEAGFIGKWGEWYYTSRYGNAGVVSAAQMQSRYRIVRRMADSVPIEVPIAVRWSHWADQLIKLDISLRDRLALYDDCIFAPYNDLGTFNDAHESTAAYPFGSGGETCSSSFDLDSSTHSCAAFRLALQRVNATYVNIDYDRTKLAQYQQCNFEDLLGYRLSIRDQRVECVDGSCEVSIELENTGLARPTRDKRVVVLCGDTAQSVAEVDIRNDIELPAPAG
ncbi:hypothetical protein P43SY_009548 [Pythium insidiosum]|uniref:Uncharacterized protein n=1 Tax=Pythium insidiosum TaxID=114742 RepID=A0AAD5QBQ9_PYTIN|nr:hypothetical protein P43SY_009548 [Pythium insidiosum]